MKAPKSFSIRQTKYTIPSTIHCLGEDAYKLLEQWPTNSSDKMFTNESRWLVNNQMKVLSPSISNLPSRKRKPRFLEVLEKYINQEFQKHSIQDDIHNPVKLQVYREVFEKIIQAFQTYKPLLSKIKHEYESNLSKLSERIQILEPMKEILWTIQSERDQTILEIRNKENKQIERLVQENQIIQNRMAEEKSENKSLHTQINRLKQDISTEYLAHLDEVDSKKLLCLEIDRLKENIQDLLLLHEEKEEKDDPVLLRMSLEEAKKDHARVLDELNKMKTEFFEFVSIKKYNNLQEKYNGVYAGYQEALKSYDAVKAELETLKEQFKALQEQRDFYYLKFMDSQSVKEKQKSFNIDALVNGALNKYQNMAGQNSMNIKNQIMADKLEIGNRSSFKMEPVNTDLSREKQRIAMITKIEIMCNLPPGSIPKNFDPNELMNLFNASFTNN